jgi:dihydrofolate synthase / folylpolyglutamate synthase
MARQDQDALVYLSSLQGMGIRMDLGPESRLLDRLGNPQKKYKTIIVGGTNGKGSIAATLSSILVSGGYRVGLYTSPHLIDFTERIRINGLPISPGDLRRLIQEVRRQITEDVTYFEVATALAFLYFFETSVDVAVLEVGLGGRLDATNVCDSEVSVISNVTLEHREYLGRTLQDIAFEKAGIIKENGVCVTAVGKGKALEIIEKICREKNSRLYRIGREIRIRALPDGFFSYRGIEKQYDRLSTPLLGRHQRVNAACAVGAVELLTKQGFLLDDASVLRGLQDVHWEGRLEVLARSPMVVVDGAHNPAGASALREALVGIFPGRRVVLVLGVLRDKDYRGIMRRLAPLAHCVILTKPSADRALHPRELEDEARKYNRDVEVVENPQRALERALTRAQSEDLICLTGSLYLVGEIKKIYRPN